MTSYHRNCGIDIPTSNTSYIATYLRRQRYPLYPRKRKTSGQPYKDGGPILASDLNSQSPSADYEPSSRVASATTFLFIFFSLTLILCISTIFHSSIRHPNKKACIIFNTSIVIHYYLRFIKHLLQFKKKKKAPPPIIQVFRAVTHCI